MCISLVKMHIPLCKWKRIMKNYHYTIYEGPLKVGKRHPAFTKKMRLYSIQLLLFGKNEVL